MPAKLMKTSKKTKDYRLFFIFGKQQKTKKTVSP